MSTSSKCPYGKDMNILSDLNSFEKTVVLTGIADYFRYKNRCPTYWRKKPEEALWKKGYNYAKKECSRNAT